jgi:hypothetical protein
MDLPDIVIDEPSGSGKPHQSGPDSSDSPALSDRRLSRRNSTSLKMEDQNYKEVDLSTYFEELHHQLFNNLKRENSNSVFVKDLTSVIINN